MSEYEDKANIRHSVLCDGSCSYVAGSTMILRYRPDFTEHCMELVEGGEWVKVKDITQLLKWLEPTEDVVHNEALSELEESLK